MKKTNMVIVMLFCLMTVLLTGCGMESAPNEEKMAIDLVDYGGNVFYLNNQDEVLEVTSLVLEKRKTDEEEGYDEAFVEVVFENECYCVTADCILGYSYYDEGGWCLDFCSVEEYESRAKKSAVTEESFLGYLSNHFSQVTIDDRNEDILADGTYFDAIYFSGAVESPYATTHYAGECILEFFDNAWYESWNVWYTGTDWNGFLGNWEYVERSWFYGTEMVGVDITKLEHIGYDTMSVTYTSATSPWMFNDDAEALEVISQGEKTENRTIEFSNEVLLGIEVSVPQSFSVLIPRGVIAGGQKYTGIYFDRDLGVYSTDDVYEQSTAEFTKKG